MVCWLGLVSLVMGQAGKGLAQFIPEKIIIDKGIYRTDIYEAVEYNHSAHVIEYGIVCRSCHHTWIQEETDYPDKCNYCHEAEDLDGLPLRDAYMNKCRGCHGNLKLEGKPAGPTRCNDCHQKKIKNK